MLPLAISDVPLTCLNEAALTYHVPAKVLVAVLNVERGHRGLAKPNANGTYDLGPMQINTRWWPTLSAYGITPQQVRDDPCVNIKVGAWLLAKAIAHGSDFLAGIGDYHSHTPAYNQRYSQQVKITYTYLTELLDH